MVLAAWDPVAAAQGREQRCVPGGWPQGCPSPYQHARNRGGGTGMSPLPQRGEKGCASVAQPRGQPDELGACWKMTLGGKSTQGF